MMLRILAALLLVSLAGCSRVQTGSEIDSGADFASLKTFGWMSGAEQQAEDVRLNDPRIQETIRAAVEKSLSDKGYELVDRERADFLVTWFGAIEKKIRQESLDHFYAPYGYGTLYRDPALNTAPAGTVLEYEEGTVIVDILDPRTGKILWRGSGSGRLLENQSEEIMLHNLRRSVAKIVGPFPAR